MAIHLNKDQVLINGNTYSIIRSKRHKKEGCTYYVLGPGMQRAKVFHDNRIETGKQQALNWIKQREEAAAVGATN